MTYKTRGCNFKDAPFRKYVSRCQDASSIPKIYTPQVVLAIRTWAVWNGNKVVGIGLVVVTLVNLVLQCTSTVKPSRIIECAFAFISK